MCNFFSFVTEPEQHGGQRFYFNKEQRETPDFLETNNIGSFDSHSSITKFYGLRENQCNKYEFKPTIDMFVIDTIGSPVNDSVQAEEWVKGLNFRKKICRALNFNIGDVVVFLPLEEIKVKGVECGWNEKMNYLIEQSVEITITKEMKNEYEYGEPNFCAINDSKGNTWYISPDMVMKKP